MSARLSFEKILSPPLMEALAPLLQGETQKGPRRFTADLLKKASKASFASCIPEYLRELREALKGEDFHSQNVAKNLLSKFVVLVERDERFQDYRYQHLKEALESLPPDEREMLRAYYQGKRDRIVARCADRCLAKSPATSSLQVGS